MKTIVITGANAGIGKAIAVQLAQAGHHVVAVCRDETRGMAAVTEIRATAPDARVDLILGDVSTVAGVRALATKLLAQFHAIHVLVNNAGVWMTERKLNKDGIEMTFMVNHLAPFLLSILLLERLKASAPARIVNVNAGLYAKGEADLEQLPSGANFNRFKTYMHSKLCNVYFTTEMARRLEGTGVTINALHPGVIRTNLGDAPGALGALIRFAKRFWKSPGDGAEPVVRLAIADDVEASSGKYFNELQEIPIEPNAQNADVSKRLWSLSEKLCGIQN